VPPRAAIGDLRNRARRGSRDAIRELLERTHPVSIAAAVGAVMYRPTQRGGASAPAPWQFDLICDTYDDWIQAREIAALPEAA
jgi:hypothetical protein